MADGYDYARGVIDGAALAEGTLTDFARTNPLFREAVNAILNLVAEARTKTSVDAMKPAAPTEDTRDWYWREEGYDERPHGPYETREAAMADVRGYYDEGECPARVLVRRCTDPHGRVTIDGDDVREILADRAMGDGYELDIALVDVEAANAELDAWLRRHIQIDAEWLCSDDEELAEVPALEVSHD